MSDPRAALDAYEGECLRNFTANEVAQGRRVAPAAFRALHEVLNLHVPFTLTTSRFKPKPIGCDHCSTDTALTEWPCPTVQVILDALEAS